MYVLRKAKVRKAVYTISIYILFIHIYCGDINKNY